MGAGGHSGRLRPEGERGGRLPRRSTVLLALRGNAFKPPEQPARRRSPRSRRLHREPLEGRQFIELAAGDDVDMTGAEFILTVGRGIGEEANVAKFASWPMRSVRRSAVPGRSRTRLAAEVPAGRSIRQDGECV